MAYVWMRVRLSLSSTGMMRCSERSGSRGVAETERTGVNGVDRDVVEDTVTAVSAHVDEDSITGRRAVYS